MRTVRQELRILVKFASLDILDQDPWKLTVTYIFMIGGGTDRTNLGTKCAYLDLGFK